MIPESPHRRFLADKEAASAHAKLMSSAQFEHAADLAMLQTRLSLPLSSGIEQAAANHYRMQGAERFLLELMTLGDPLSQHTPLESNALDYEATKIK